jgi:hypothetical protein
MTVCEKERHGRITMEAFSKCKVTTGLANMGPIIAIKPSNRVSTCLQRGVVQALFSEDFKLPKLFTNKYCGTQR